MTLWEFCAGGTFAGGVPHREELFQFHLRERETQR